MDYSSLASPASLSPLEGRGVDGGRDLPRHRPQVLAHALQVAQDGHADPLARRQVEDGAHPRLSSQVVDLAAVARDHPSQAVPGGAPVPQALGREGQPERLRPEQLLVVNCPGQLDRLTVQRIRDFVSAGGSLFTTDWALRHVLEPAFPGVLEYNERPTRDDVVRVEIRSAGNPFLRGVIDPGEDPLWWLEGSSYPIRVLDPGVDIHIPARDDLILTKRFADRPKDLEDIRLLRALGPEGVRIAAHEDAAQVLARPQIVERAAARRTDGGWSAVAAR